MALSGTRTSTWSCWPEGLTNICTVTSLGISCANVICPGAQSTPAISTANRHNATRQPFSIAAYYADATGETSEKEFRALPNCVYSRRFYNSGRSEALVDCG